MNQIFFYRIKVVIGSVWGKIHIFDEISYSLVKSFLAHTAQINQIKELPNGLVATCSWDQTAKIWNSSSVRSSNKNVWNLTLTYTGHNGVVYALEYVNTNTMASCSSDLTIKIWSIKTGATLRTIQRSADTFTLCLLNNGFHLAAAGDSMGDISIFDINAGTLISTLQGHNKSVSDLEVIGSDLLASSSWDLTIRIWNLTRNDCKFVLLGHSSEVLGLKMLSLDVLASGSYDSNVKLWNVTSGSLSRSIQIECTQKFFEFLNSHTLVCNNDSKSQLIIWDWNTEKVLKAIYINSRSIPSFRAYSVLQQVTAKGKHKPYIFQLISFQINF